MDNNSKHIPPQNSDAEASLLGAVLIDTDALVRIADQVSTEDFYDRKHALMTPARCRGRPPSRGTPDSLA